MKVTDQMVQRFLGWPLPKDFAPDCGISFNYAADARGYMPSWPIGTNLFHEGQARAMLEYACEKESFKLTGQQIKQLADFTGGEDEAQLSIAWFDAREPDADGNEMPAGLWAWYTEYPDEGAIFLGNLP